MYQQGTILGFFLQINLDNLPFLSLRDADFYMADTGGNLLCVFSLSRHSNTLSPSTFLLWNKFLAL